MITLLFLVFVFMIVFGILGLCLRLTGGVLKLACKLIFILPIGILCAALGVVFCCTLILIPLGIACFKLTGSLLTALVC